MLTEAARESLRAEARAIMKSANENPRDVLSQMDRDIVGGPVRITIQLNDPVELKRHLALLAGIIESIRVDLDRAGRKDRTVLLAARAKLRHANQKLNAFKARKNGAYSDR